MAKSGKKNWIQGAVEHPGALREKAKKAGAVNGEGNIEKSFIKEKAKGNGTTAKQARLAETFEGMRKGKGK